MIPIGGNISGQLQIKNGFTRNEIGEKIENWETIQTLTGFLDYQSGDSQYQNYSAKVQETTHVFVCDYVDLENVNAENARMIFNNKRYDVLLIDNPMELNYQLEIYLKFTGVQ